MVRKPRELSRKVGVGTPVGFHPVHVGVKTCKVAGCRYPIDLSVYAAIPELMDAG